MKKLAGVVSCIVCLMFSGCSGNSVSVLCPDNETMRNRLEEQGYEVIVTEPVEEGTTGTYLSAIKGDDYIEFYWLEDADDVENISDELKARHNDYSELNSMEDELVRIPMFFAVHQML
ncbi:hypothetical protein [Cellulosilyticum ruminicola]|uniref:hypothetical protein n=1 Tax=Cellulosilyticum ruminicola TaxID=425254 RepID=UPI0012EE20CD|nr:hypothetical protein [Cellulosilyticum ruminicola]